MVLSCLSFQSSFTTTMFICKVFVHVVFLVLLVSSVTAAPVVKGLLPDTVQLSARENHMKTAVRIARQIKHSLIAIPNKSVFYTGHKPGKKGPIPVKQTAEYFAKANEKKQLLGHALAKAKIRIPSENKNLHANRLWKIASKVYAMRSSGVAHAFIGKWVGKENVYHKIEKPTLLKNPKVSKLIEHNGETGAITIVK